MENAPEINPEIKNPANLIYKENFDGTINKEIFNLNRMEESRYVFTEIDGKKAIEITVREGDKEEIASNGTYTERAEISENKDIFAPIGNEVWHGLSVYFPPDFTIEKNRLVFAQWKQKTEGDESPFLSLRYINGKLIVQVSNENEKINIFRKKIDLRGGWHDFKIDYKLDKKDSGFAKVWMGDDLIADYEGKMGYSDSRELAYFKAGLYRDKSKIPQIVGLTAVRRGPTKESIS